MKWRNLSIANRLYLVVGIMAVLIAGELMTLRFTLHKLSAVRAFVGGEGSWSKSQKNAVFALQRYAATRDEADYREYLDYLKVPEGDHLARIELEKRHPDYALVRRGFTQGQIHPDDIDGMIELIRSDAQISYLARAIAIWTAGDGLLDQLKAAGEACHEALSARPPDRAGAAGAMARVRELNTRMTVLEDNFSEALGEGSRWLERLVMSLLSIAVLMVESVGLTLTFRTSRRISRGLNSLNDVARRIGRGDYGARLEVSDATKYPEHRQDGDARRYPEHRQDGDARRYNDEIGMLTESINEMGGLLESAYRDLERRVRERTEQLEGLAGENRKLYEEAREALRARDEFLSIASHELKTPLSALFLRLQLLHRSVAQDGALLDPEPFREGLGKIMEQARRLASLIDELLDLTRIRAGRLVLERERVDLREVLREVLSQLSTQITGSGSEVTVRAEEPVVGLFDPIRMSQIMMNLVSNALKYGEGKPIEVTLAKAAAGRVSLTVRDQGPGIPSDKQARIFERFERAVTDHRISGLGLGLYIARQIVEAHGGRLSVESEAGHGALFSVEMPLES